MAQTNIPSSGLWGTIANALNSMFTELFGRTGFESHIDTQYTVSAPFTLSANTDTDLPNNQGTIVNSQSPVDVTEFYDGTTITGRNGDGVAIMIYFKAKSSTVDQWLDIWIDIGGTVGELYRQTFSFPKGSGTERGILYALPAAYTLGTFEANGGTVKVRSNASTEIYNINYNFNRNSKAR